MRRGRRRQSDPNFHLNNAFTLTAIAPLHRVMCVLFKASSEVVVPNRAMADLCRLLQCSTADAGGL
eukprot:2004283-Lingulodinium_polyedra.AAC.1